MNALHWSKGNEKVDCAVVNFGSGLECPSSAWCEFSPVNYKESGKPLCYACKSEIRFGIDKPKNYVLKNRRENQQMIEEATRKGDAACFTLAYESAKPIIAWSKKQGLSFVRINESGDLFNGNIGFACQLIREFKNAGITPYLYTKANKACVDMARQAGAIVLQSEVDFVCVKTEQEAEEKGLRVCPGIGCGKRCLRCCKGMQSAVIAH